MIRLNVASIGIKLTKYNTTPIITSVINSAIMVLFVLLKVGFKI